MNNFVFEVKYELDFESGEGSSNRQRVLVKKYDAQLAVDKVKADAMKSTRWDDEAGKRVKATAFRLTSVDFVTDFDR